MQCERGPLSPFLERLCCAVEFHSSLSVGRKQSPSNRVEFFESDLLLELTEHDPSATKEAGTCDRVSVAGKVVFRIEDKLTPASRFGDVIE